MATLCCFVLVLLCAGTTSAQADLEAEREALARARNRGHAFLEMPGHERDAVEAWRQAVALAPRSGRDHLGLALALERAGEPAAALETLAEAAALDPVRPEPWAERARLLAARDDFAGALAALETLLSLAPETARSHLEAGDLATELGNTQSAFRHYETAARLAPDWAEPRWRLSDLHRLAGRTADADRERGQAIALGHDDQPPPRDPFPFVFEPEPGRVPSGEGVELPSFVPRTLAWGVEGGAVTGLVLLDADGDGGNDLLILTTDGLHLLADGLTPRRESLVALWTAGRAEGESSGFEGEGPARFVHAVPGDADGDDLPDLCLLDARGRPWLARNEGGRFSLVGVPLPPGPFNDAHWMDLEDDGDADLLLLGPRPVALMNDGVWTFIDRSHRFPFVDGQAFAGAVLTGGLPDAEALTHDLAVVHAARRGVLYRESVGGGYEAELLLGVPLALTEAVGYDADHDGRTDLLVANASMAVLFLADALGGFRRAASLPGGTPPVLWADFRGRGIADLVAGGRIHPNRGLGRLAPAERPLGWPAELSAAVAADWVGENESGDGHLDLAVVDGSGHLLMLRNAAGTPARAVTIELRGGASLGAVIELMAGTLYAARLVEGSGAPVFFALGGRPLADVLRITWPDGRRDHRLDVTAGETLVVER